MDKEKIQALLIDYLNGELSEEQQIEVQNLLQENPTLREEYIAMYQIHTQMEMNSHPEPSSQLSANFYQMLAREKQAKNKKPTWYENLSLTFQQFRQPNLPGQLAFGVVLLLLGFSLGFWLRPQTEKPKKIPQEDKLGELTKEVQEMRKMMMLSLLEKQSASERLKAVNLTTSLEKVDDKVVEALLKTLNNDSNINVRLVTVETLLELADNPKVRQGLIQSITKQESPLVQIALVDVMLALQEKQSVKELKKLLKRQDLNEMVKGKIEQSIRVLL